ncbi:hypothetical protein GPECTOR_32g516 [Gonium pectorale]|uniref:Uncharacterized protein n=1 Tax=Gonium pectorale TaxID=33097 RepID=A0A150GDQ1_GONPE|nr:hypothetical protein GPECTOR_32g516 [Gonium pectorale]|eukprot:KXZ47903.1 hypothetical protein GPECTOR_32g516 [Gonium pectorale]
MWEGGYAEPEEDPLLTVAREWGSLTAVLCLDELHVTDVADAMILSRLFGALLTRHSTALLFTSNRPPRDLYKGGLSRKYFEPFIRLVDEQMVVVAGSWHVGSGAEVRLHAAWQRHLAAAMAGGGGDGDVGGGGSGSGCGVEVSLAYGRTLKLPLADGDAAFLTFDQLCGSRGLRAGVDDGGALAAPDYLALCRRFRTLYVSGVPRLDPGHRDEARRLVTLLDVAYDCRTRLEVAAEVLPDELFVELLQQAARQVGAGWVAGPWLGSKM